MKKESIESLRSRLRQDEGLQEMIRIRAFEIFQSRGGSAGNPHHDWLQAENETLMILIEKESKSAKAFDGARPSNGVEPAATPKKKTLKVASTRKSAAKTTADKAPARKKSTKSKKSEDKVN